MSNTARFISMAAAAGALAVAMTGCASGPRPPGMPWYVSANPFTIADYSAVCIAARAQPGGIEANPHSDKSRACGFLTTRPEVLAYIDKQSKPRTAVYQNYRVHAKDGTTFIEVRGNDIYVHKR